MTKKIGAISTFIKRIKGIKPKEDHSLFFRGHSDEAYVDIPSIYRTLKSDKNIRPYINDEHIIFRKIIMACPNDFSNCKSAFDYLVKMQHYNLPTRLLDITSNPLVALYFSCISHNGKGGKNGEVIVYEIPNEKIKYYSSDTASVIANIAKRPNDLSVSSLKSIKRDKWIEEKYFSRLMHEIQEEKPYFKDEIEIEHLESVICVQPKLENQRLIKQSGSFLLFGINENKLKHAKIPDYFYKKTIDGNKEELIIAQNGKNIMLKELEELSISEATLFPEIDKVSKYLTYKLESKAANK